MKQRLLRLMAWVMSRAGLLPLFLSFTHRWRVTRAGDQRVVFPFVAKRQIPSFLILCYHRVNDDRDPFFSGVPVGVFAGQMEALRAYFNVLPLDEVVERAAKNDIPPHAVAITFDDGYQDNYANAFPILKRLDLPATIFLVTGTLDSAAPIWHDRVFDAFRRTNAGSFIFGGHEYSSGTLGEKQTALCDVLQDLRRCSPPERDELIGKLHVELGVAESCHASAQKLSWKEIREMARVRITFGAHTVTHPILTRVPLSEAANEIVVSKQTIESELGSPVKLFAYPNGSRADFDEDIKRIVRETGILCAVTTVWGANNMHSDPFELRRLGFYGSTPPISVLQLGMHKFFS